MLWGAFSSGLLRSACVDYWIMFDSPNVPDDFSLVESTMGYDRFFVYFNTEAAKVTSGNIFERSLVHRK